MKITTRQPYLTDLTDQEWTILEPFMPELKLRGRPRQHSWREILNAIYYAVRTGGAWRHLPHDFPAWQSVYYYFRVWRLSGFWHFVHTAIRQQLRLKLGRNIEPSAAIIDSQSVKTTFVRGERGYDGGKKVNGRKRHILVDTNGFILRVKVHPANIGEREGAKLLLAPLKTQLPRLELLWADAGYNGTFFKEWVKEQLGWSVKVVKRPSKWVWTPPDVEPPPLPQRLEILPRRWVVERTFGWITRSRRLSRDYEGLAETSEMLIYLTTLRLMVTRLTRL